jgi:glycosyltransferase involved in cell wall biosynthesis
LAHVIDSLGISGGAEKNLTRNLRLWDHDRFEHELVILRHETDNLLADVPSNVPITMLFEEHEVESRMPATRRLLALTRERHFDLIHAALPFGAFAARTVGFLRSTKVVESLVNISHEPVRCQDNPSVTPAKLRHHTMLDRASMKGIDAFHAVSQAVADSWVRVVGIPADRVEVIPRGVDVSAIPTLTSMDQPTRRAIRSEIGLPPDAFVVVNVGRHEAQKGQRYLIEAAGLVRDSLPDLHVVVVGREGHLTAALRSQIAAAGLEDRVHLIGSRTDVHRLMAACDVFAFPSLFEGNGGNAMVEAMAIGLPIITTGSAPMTDLVPDDRHGRLCARGDSSAIAAALKELHDDPSLRSRLGQAVRDRVLTFPDDKTIAARFEDWYDRLLSSGDR